MLIYCDLFFLNITLVKLRKGTPI